MLSDNKIAKLQGSLGKDTVEELDKMSTDQLKSRLVQAQKSIKQAKEELEANQEYQQIKADKTHLEQGLKEVKKRQNAISDYALHLMETKGE
jgi:hypothetical protein